MAALSEGGKIRVETVVLPDGEEHKNMEVLMKVILKYGRSSVNLYEIYENLTLNWQPAS